MWSRRAILASLAAGMTVRPALAQARTKIELWDNRTGPHLRGAVLAQRRVYADIDGPDFLGPGAVGAPVDDAALDRLVAAGANLVVLSHPGIYQEAAPYEPDRRIIAHLEDLVERCGRRGLYVVIAYRTGPGRSEFTFHRDDAGRWFPAHMIDERVWSDFRCHGAWEMMWRDTARRFRGHANVVGYLLMVEPNANQAGPQGEIWSPSELRPAVAGTPADWPHLATRLVRSIRREDADTPILINPDGYANIAFADFLDLEQDPALVLALHDYSPRDYTHQTAGRARSWRAGDAALPPVQADRWMMGEFGAARWAPGLEHYLDERIDQLETSGAGWAYFRWDSGWDIYERQENRFNLRYGPDPSSSQSSAHPALSVLEAAWSRNRQTAAPCLRL